MRATLHMAFDRNSGAIIMRRAHVGYYYASPDRTQ
jgi:hypothetical protein